MPKPKLIGTIGVRGLVNLELSPKLATVEQDTLLRVHRGQKLTVKLALEQFGRLVVDVVLLKRLSYPSGAVSIARHPIAAV